MSEEEPVEEESEGAAPVAPAAPVSKAELDRAFSELYKAHLRDVYSYAYYRVGNHHDAEDLTEQAFLQAYRHFERARRESNGRPLRPWLIRIAHNLASNYYRDRARRPEANIEAVEPPAHPHETERVVDSRRAGVTISYSPEFADLETNTALLKTLARITASGRMRDLPNKRQLGNLGRLLALNDTQEGVLNLVFKVADDQGLLLLDLKDLRAVLQFVGDNAASFKTQYGNVSAASIGTIQRALLALESQGGDRF